MLEEIVGTRKCTILRAKTVQRVTSVSLLRVGYATRITVM
jgi:hypothetical protein